ncbi:MAG: T9SS type A sorting domain-containing protein, partial [Hymenobacter sp.]|nr:T9SS type A sorting domain-containing protein [Hymenobacter sp.]
AIATAGTYTFYLTSDDASYLWLDNAALQAPPANGAALINNGGLHEVETVTATVSLTAGLHDLLVHFGEDAVGNVLTLEYSSLDARVARQTIPATAFCSTVNGIAPLPVSLVSFAARPGSEAVELSWVTAQEQNSSHYTVERSANAAVFEAVTRVAAAGNSSQRQHYAFTDRTPLPGLNYYRLHQVDRDGKNTYSQVVAAMVGPGKENRLVLSAAPNPSAGSFMVRVAQSQPHPGQLQLLDLRGRVRYEQALAGAAQQEVSMKVLGLPAGLYLLRLLTANGTATHKVMIE